MWLILTLLVAIVLVLIVSVLGIGAIGAAGILIFGDAIVCAGALIALVFFLIRRKIRKRKP